MKRQATMRNNLGNNISDLGDDTPHDGLLVPRAAGLAGGAGPALAPHVQRARTQLLLQGKRQEANIMLLNSIC